MHPVRQSNAEVAKHTTVKATAEKNDMSELPEVSVNRSLSPPSTQLPRTPPTQDCQSETSKDVDQYFLD